MGVPDRRAWPPSAHRSRPVLNLLLVGLCLLAAPAFPHLARAQDVPPGTPPEIRQIITKMKSGQMPTAAEMQKLQEWSQGMASRANAPQAAGSQFNPAQVQKGLPDGIPCAVHITFHYHSQDSHAASVSMTADLDGETKAVLFAVIDGLGDYRRAVTDSSVHASSFRFEPDAPGGRPSLEGTGTCSWEEHSGVCCWNEGRTSITQASFGMMMVTTGHGDALAPGSAGGFGGHVHGSRNWHQNDGLSGTDPIDEGDLGDLDLVPPCPYEAAFPVGDHDPTPVPQFKISGQALIDAVRSGRTATVTGSESFDFTRNGTRYVGTSTVAITLRPSPMELDVEPADAAAYERWLPMPSDPADDAVGPATPFEVHVALRDKDRQPPKVGGRIEVYLDPDEVSHNRGLCMNYPQDGTVRAGMVFDPHQPSGIMYVDSMHVQTMSTEATEATVVLLPRETAAWGLVRARCEALGLQSTDPRTHEAFLRVPKDDNHNEIADPWEKDQGIYEKNLPASWDEEDKPAGMKDKGDGLTLYEEYRGFLQEEADIEVFRRLQSTTRKLFVFVAQDPDRELMLQGARLYQASSGVEVHVIHAVTRMKQYDSPLYIKWINFNDTPHTLDKQVAVWIEDKPYPKPDSACGYCKPKAGDDDETPQRPTTVVKVDVSRMGCGFLVTSMARFWYKRFHDVPDFTSPLPVDSLPRSVRAAAAALGIDPLPIGPKALATREDLVRRLITFSTCHELGHATGGRHHWQENYDVNGDVTFLAEGDPSCPMRYWQAESDKVATLLFMSGQWTLATASSGKPWTYCYVDMGNMSLRP